MDENRLHVKRAAAKLLNALDDEGYDGWLCVREQEDDARIKDWSFVAAKTPEDLFRLVFHLVEILYTVEDD